MRIGTNGDITTVSTEKVRFRQTLLSRSMQTSVSNGSYRKAFLLKKRKDLRGLRVGHLARVFLHKHGFDGVVVRDDDEALCGRKRKTKRESERGRVRQSSRTEAREVFVTFARGAPKTGEPSRTRPRLETKSAWSSAMKRTAVLSWISLARKNKDQNGLRLTRSIRRELFLPRPTEIPEMSNKKRKPKRREKVLSHSEEDTGSERIA